MNRYCQENDVTTNVFPDFSKKASGGRQSPDVTRDAWLPSPGNAVQKIARSRRETQKRRESQRNAENRRESQIRGLTSPARRILNSRASFAGFANSSKAVRGLS